MQNTWTDERVEQLRQLAAGNYSCSQIAAIMDCGITRNSVIGKLGRLGIVKQNVQRDPNDVRVKPTLRIAYVNGNSNQMRVTRSTRRAEPVPLICVDVVPRNLTLAELDEKTECHFIPGEDYLYCGHPVKHGSSFCFQHHGLCWTSPGPVRDRVMRREVA